MPWVKVDDHAPDHPKFLALGSSRLAGTGLWLIALAYANRFLTDGFVPVGAFPAGSAVVKRLVDVGLLEPAPGGYLIHDYLDYQPSREVVEADRLAEHDAKVAGGKARARKAKRTGGKFAPADTPADDQQAAGDVLAPAEPAGHQQAASPVPVPVPVVGTTDSGGAHPRLHSPSNHVAARRKREERDNDEGVQAPVEYGEAEVLL